MTKLEIALRNGPALALALALGAAIAGCTNPTPPEKTAQAMPATDKSVDEGYPLNGGAVLRCRTPDGGFTTICRTP